MTTPCADMVAGHRRQWAPMAVVASWIPAVVWSRVS